MIDKGVFKDTFQKDFDDYFCDEAVHIALCIKEGLLLEEKDCLRVSDLGKIFIRNICMGFDWYLKQPKTHRRFSQTV
ncbi:MAG: hypothetical protein A2Z88_04440 [Omnitrophica WOR_2 bacterium GWA2_47_8]|nr:MAG: hypothetical protein A2Z88_04440 [Omnitrophica WOR_2 bacterium GWA2_47_8]